MLGGWASGFQSVGDVGCDGRARIGGGGGWLFSVWLGLVVEVVGLAEVVGDLGDESEE